MAAGGADQATGRRPAFSNGAAWGKCRATGASLAKPQLTGRQIYHQAILRQRFAAPSGDSRVHRYSWLALSRSGRFVAQDITKSG